VATGSPEAEAPLERPVGVIGLEVEAVQVHIRMHKITLYLDDEVRERIAHIAKETGRSQAEVIRDALHAFFTRKKPRSIGLGKGGRDLSDRADDLLDGFGEL
jgi:predicted transcriptional regulator